MLPEWVGTALFVAALVLTSAKVARDFGDRGLQGYAMLLLLIIVYAGAVGLAFS